METYDALLAYARRRVGLEQARDVVSETFLVAWRRFEEVPEDALPWLYGVARRVLANQRRASRRRAALLVRLESQPGQLHVADEANGGCVLNALAQLPERDREVLMLLVWEGLDVGQAAEVLGCSAAAVSLRLHRARKRLRAALRVDPGLAQSTRDAAFPSEVSDAW
jgi:RNA polymerase sigma-70 factor (ECF subfamily)